MSESVRAEDTPEANQPELKMSPWIAGVGRYTMEEPMPTQPAIALFLN